MDPEDVLGASCGEIPRELAEGTLRLARARQEFPLDDDLAPRRHMQVDSGAPGDFHRLAENPAARLELADLRRGIGEEAHQDEGVQAQTDRRGHVFAPLLVQALVVEHPSARMQTATHFPGSFDLQPVESPRFHSGVRMPGHHHPAREVGPGVSGEVGGDGEPAEVGVLAGPDHLAEGGRLHHARVDVTLETAGVRLRQLGLRHAQGHRLRAAACQDVADHGNRMAPDVLEEEDGIALPPLVFENERHDVVFEVDRLGDANHLARVGPLKLPDETPQVLIHALAFRSGNAAA